MLWYIKLKPPPLIGSNIYSVLGEVKKYSWELKFFTSNFCFEIDFEPPYMNF